MDAALTNRCANLTPSTRALGGNRSTTSNAVLPDVETCYDRVKPTTKRQNINNGWASKDNMILYVYTQITDFTK